MYVISHNYAKFKVDAYDSLPVEKTLTFHNVIILTKSRIKVTITIINSQKNVLMNDLKIIKNKFLYKL